MAVLDELKRRGVIRATLAYLAAAWLLIQIADTVFPAYGVSGQVLTTLITVLAVGFIPTMAVVWFFELTPDGLARDNGPGQNSARIRKSQTIDRGIATMLALAVVVFAVDKFVLDPQRDLERVEHAEAQGRLAALLEFQGEQSIVVLPFEQRNSNPEHAFLAEGIAGEILIRLNTVPELRVISRTSAFAFRDQDLSPIEIAQRLNVANVLIGNMRSIGERMRISVELIDAASNSVLWAASYDREMTNIFDVEDEVAGQVFDALQIRWRGDSPNGESGNPEAQALMLRAQHIITNGEFDELGAAEKLLEQAIEIDDRFVRAYTLLASIYTTYSLRLTSADERELHWNNIRGISAILSEIAPGSADDYLWRLLGLGITIGPTRAAQLTERAIHLYPTHPQLLQYTAAFFNRYGRPDIAIRLAEFGLRRDPLCVYCLTDLGKYYRTAGRFDEAVDAMRMATHWAPGNPRNNWALGAALLFAGEAEEALQLFDNPTSPEEQLGRIIALYETGHLQQFQEEFARFRSEVGMKEGTARIYAWIGNSDAVIENLRRVVETDGKDNLEPVYFGGWYRQMFEEPEFVEFLESAGWPRDFPPKIEYEVTLPDIILRETD